MRGLKTLDPEVSRITLVSTGDEQIIEQIIKQLHKLINIIKVVDLSELEHVEREMVLVRVKAEDKSRAEVLRIADIFRCRVVDVSASTYTLEITGNHEKIRAVLDLLKNHGIQEVARPAPWPSSGARRIRRSGKLSAVSSQLWVFIFSIFAYMDCRARHVPILVGKTHTPKTT